MDVLGALAVDFDRGIHIDCLHQFSQGIGVKLLNAYILVRFLDELLNVFVAAGKPNPGISVWTVLPLPL